jgi:hypothetical protein
MTTPNYYDIGDTVTLVNCIAATVDGGMIDPTSLYLTLKWPDGSVGSWDLTDFMKINTGHYEFNVNCLNLSGIYWQRWHSTGSGQAAEVKNFIVRDNEGAI